MVVEHVLSAPQFTIESVPKMPLPWGALMCPPDWFDVVDVKNPYMVGQQGHVDVALAKKQWLEVKRAFQHAGVEVRTDNSIPGCEDMVFCANPIFTGLDEKGRRVCLLSHMRYASRQREVEAHAAWFRANGYEVVSIEDAELFEGEGDALWHPGRRLIWGGYGFRSSRNVYDRVGRVFDVPVLALELRTEQFYHLDTCLCLIDEQTALVYPGALTDEGMDLLQRMFRNVIEADRQEALAMACNAAAFLGATVVIQQGSERINRKLRALGYEVIEVDTSEFMKSGGSVFCMKMYLF